MSQPIWTRLPAQTFDITHASYICISALCVQQRYGQIMILLFSIDLLICTKYCYLFTRVGYQITSKLIKEHIDLAV